jgi:hypothetical protein
VEKRVYNLLTALEAAAKDAEGKRPCRLCEVLQSMDAGSAAVVREMLGALRPDGRALLGARKLYPILNNNGYDVPIRDIERHRTESHK